MPTLPSGRRVKVLVPVLTAIAASALWGGTASPAAASCTPVAHVPSVSGGLGFAFADLPCTGSYTIKLVNNAGSVLASSSGTGAGGVQTSTTRCAGAIVHTFVTDNVNGTVMSDTSGTIQC